MIFSALGGLTASPPLGTAMVVANINGTLTTLLSVTASTARATYPATVPAGTPLNTVTVEVKADANDPPTGGTNRVNVSIFDNYIKS